MHTYVHFILYDFFIKFGYCLYLVLYGFYLVILFFLIAFLLK